MTDAGPPRLALALLLRCVPANEPLVGDLLEQFAVRRSRAWFWHQVLLAIFAERRQRGDARHPLRLTDDFQDEPIPIRLPARVGLSASALPDVGGLGILVLLVIVAMVRPEAWLMGVSAVLGGAVIGAVLAVARSRRMRSAPGQPRRLFDSTPPAPPAP